mmetsp:Transcript_7010/g.7697  ORF Transcript_7010/g.7697 Transcript_7010/m.7697 type:complete len:125 (-) Transcript_7010:56-430(-)
MAEENKKRIDGTRMKVPLAKGKGLAQWMRLISKENNLTGVKRGPITKEEVKKHKTDEDCWIILNGNVYNVTEYLDYHPGGRPKLMMAAGKDATSLFNKYHAWVNYPLLLKPCLIGPLDKSAPSA